MVTDLVTLVAALTMETGAPRRIADVSNNTRDVSRGGAGLGRSFRRGRERQRESDDDREFPAHDHSRPKDASVTRPSTLAWLSLARNLTVALSANEE